MNNKWIKILGFILLVFFALSCSKKPTKILPIRNIDNFRMAKDSVNSPKDELAPYQRTNAKNCIESSNREYGSGINYINHNHTVKPSYNFFPEIMGKDFEENYNDVLQNLTNKLEAVSFLTNNSGFLALSHPTDSNYNQALNLPIFGNVGGTDLFTFEVENGKYVFKALDSKINSIFWDSHPFAAYDTNCNLLLVWSSDRNNPYSRTFDLQNNLLVTGHTDLFYAFRDKSGKWSDVKTFDFSTGVNSDKFNDISPFISCVNVAPKLFFSSNRAGDYDIYEADLEINFNAKNIKVLNNPKILPKGREATTDSIFVNTFSNEIFPYMAMPFDNSDNKVLFLSSNRNKKEVPAIRKKDTVVVNKGNYDIYSFDYNLTCTPPPPPPPPPVPIAKLKVDLFDMNIPWRKIEKPVIKLVNKLSGEEKIVNESSHLFEVDFCTDYDVFMGSNHNNLDCNVEGDSILQYYQARKIYELNPKIIKNVEKIKYDSLENPTLVVKYDTTYTKELYPVSEVNNLQPIVDFKVTNDKVTETKSEVIKDINFKPCVLPCDTVLKNNPKLNEQSGEKLQFNKETSFFEITKQVITKREWYEGGKLVKKERTVTTFDTIPQFDTVMISAIGAVAKTEWTHLKTINICPSDGETKDVTFLDTGYLKPMYFVKPPCKCQFTDIEHKYYKNVPYFQTAFWKVNTTKGFKQHLLDFQKDNYLEKAGFIELHPRHREYGVRNENKRNDRKADYARYAIQVDTNLIIMKDEIVKRFIPAMEMLDSLVDGTKIFIKLEAFSDRRDAGLCFYIGNTVEFIQGKRDASNKIFLNKEKISNGATLSNDNENLSKLRVYYGFDEIFDLLKNDSKFKYYLNKGLVFYPTQKYDTEEQMFEAMEKAKIIILTEGKYYDKVVKTDERDYDPYRRIDMYIDLIKYRNKTIEITPCCNPKLNCYEK